MNIVELIKDSLKYPFSSWKNFLILGIFAVFSGIFTLSVLLGAKDSVLIGFLGITGCLCVVLICGYSFNIIKSSLAGVKGLPGFNNWNKMVIDGIKVIIVNIVYLIPGVLIFILVLYSGSNLTFILTILSNLNLDLLLDLGLPYFILLLIPPLYLITIIPVILMAVANMADKDSKLGAAFKFKEILSDVSKSTQDNLTGDSLVFYNSSASAIIGFIIFDEIFERISSIGWDKLIIWYIAAGIISLILILIGYFIANAASISVLHSLDLYSLSNYNILRILILSSVLLPYLFIFLSRSTALIYDSAIKSYLIRENCTGNYPLG